MNFGDDTESSSGSSVPMVPDESPGSSVSSRFQDEYEELLKYAVVVPSFDPKAAPRRLANTKASFLAASGSPILVRSQDERIRPPDTPSEESGEYSSVVESTEEAVGGAGYTRAAWDPSTPHEDQSTQPHGDSNHPAPAPHTQPPPDKQTTPARIIYNREIFNLNSPDSPDTLPGDGDIDSPGAYSPSVDADVVRVEHMLDEWCYDLKRNVLAEFSQSKIQLIEQHRLNMMREKKRHAAEVNVLQNDIESMKELLHTYELSIQRKDDVISNLTRAIQKQQERFQVAKTFSEWKVKHHERQREEFASKLARKHYERGLAQKAWESWHSIVEAKWRQRVEKACQGKAQEVCMNLTNDYEAKIASLNEALSSTRDEVSRLHKERDRYEETMKKAFMRGVCALNLEAMTMFHGEEQGDGSAPRPGSAGSGSEESEADHQHHVTIPHQHPVTIPQEPIYTSQPGTQPPPPRVITSQSATSSTFTAAKTTSKHITNTRQTPSTKQRVVTAKLSARSDAQRSGQVLGGATGPVTLAPPMSSVLVERHQPVVKQTIGHATAGKYPRPTGSSSGILQRKVAGQSGPVRLSNANIHPVTVVD